MKYHTSIKKLKLSELNQFPGNPQNVSPEKMNLIQQHMKESGWIGEIPTVAILDSKTYIISGNHRVQCALAVGIEKQSCIIIDDEKYTWKKAKTDCLMYNNLHGDPDEYKEKEFIQNLLSDFDLSVENILDDIGLDENELNDILLGEQESEIIVGDDLLEYLSFLVNVKQKKYIDKCFDKIEGENKTDKLILLCKLYIEK